MATFYAQYPANGVGTSTVQTVQGEGTPGSQTGGLLTVQGDPSGTPIPITGSITATNPSVAATGAAIPADATYVGMNVSGNLTGLIGTSNGLDVVINAAVPAGSNIIGKVGIDQTTPGTTNGVQVNAALPMGTNSIGNIGTVSAVTAITDALPAGSNTIGAITGTGTAGTPAGGILSIQGVSSGTAVTVTGTVTATNPSVGATGSTIPVDATYIGGLNGGNLIGLNADSSGRMIVAGAGTAGSAAGGVLTVQGSSSGTAIPVSTSASTAIAWQAEGNIAAASVTTSYQTVFTPSASTKILFMRNNMNQPAIVSMDAGTTINFILDAGDQVAVDFVANGVISTTTAIQIKYSGSAPTTGSFRVNAGH